jgi:cell division protein FtsB
VERVWSFMRRSWFALAALAVAGVLLLTAAWGERGLSRVLQLRTELAQTEDRNFRLVQQISALRRDIEMARTDDATLEHLARRYLGMARPGEVIYRVPPAKSATASGEHPSRQANGLKSDGAPSADEDEAVVAPAPGED